MKGWCVIGARSSGRYKYCHVSRPVRRTCKSGRIHETQGCKNIWVTPKVMHNCLIHGGILDFGRLSTIHSRIVSQGQQIVGLTSGNPEARSSTVSVTNCGASPAIVENKIDTAGIQCLISQLGLGA